MNRLLVIIMFVGLVSISSCSGLIGPPNLKNPDNGIVAIPIKASNTSVIDFYRYYKIYPHTDPDLEILINPHEGEYFVFSPELPAGTYNFNRIKILLRGHIARSGKHNSMESLKGGILIDVKPGSVTIANERLVVNAYKWQTARTAMQDWRFETVSDDEMESLIEEIKNIGGIEKLQIANELRLE